MEDIYRRLAERLDQLPNGFPATDSGVEIEILKEIFSPEEAEMALKMRPMPETTQAIASRLEMDADQLQPVLDEMARKGQIGILKVNGEWAYMLFPYVVGIYEFQLNRLNKKMAALHEDYGPTLMRTVGGHKPEMMRVVPINQAIGADLEILRCEDVRTMIEKSKSFQVMDCICRKEKELLDDRCDFPMERCMSFSREENAYEKLAMGRIIDKEEALEIINKAEEEGLVHCTYNTMYGHYFICNCCPCCCGILRGVKEYNAPHILARSNFVASINAEECEGCGVCADERCPMDAIEEDGDAYKVIDERCIGCGVCVITCPTEALSLVQLPPEKRDEPPKTIMDWMFQRASIRGVKMKMD